MRLEIPWQPIGWYLGIAVAVPLLNGAQLGEHLVTTVAVAVAFFAALCLLAVARRRIHPGLDRRRESGVTSMGSGPAD